MDKAGASLRLHALTNHLIQVHMTGREEDPELAALYLFAVTAKSLAHEGFAPANARDLVKRRQHAVMDNLRDAAAGLHADGSSSPAAADIVERARRLKKLSHKLNECSGKQLGRVRNSRVAKRLCTMFHLGHQAYHEWEDQQRRREQATSGSTSGSGSSSRASPSPSPRRRKRKTPERAQQAGRSRFGSESRVEAAPAGSPAAVAAEAAGEPPRRRRSSGSAGEEAGLQPKKLFGVGGSGSSTLCGRSAGEQQGTAGTTCAEWGAFKSFLASPCRPAAATALALDAPPSPLAAAAAAAHFPQAFAIPFGLQQQQLQQQGEQPMEICVDFRNAPAVALAAVPASPPCVPHPSPPSPHSPLGPRQLHGTLPTSPPVALGCSKMGPWGLLLPSPSDDAWATAGEGGTHEGRASKRVRPRDGALLRLHSGHSVVRAAAAAEVIAADIMLMLSGENLPGEQPGPGGSSASPSPTAASCAATDAGGIDSPSQRSAQPPPQLLSPLRPMLAAAQQHASPHVPQRRHTHSGSSAHRSKVLLCAGGDKIMMCNRRALRGAAAKEVHPAGGNLDSSRTWRNLDSCGNAASILRPLALTPAMGQRAAAAMQA